MSSEARGKSCGLKMFLSQGKRPVARKPIYAISFVAARYYALLSFSSISWTVATRPPYDRTRLYFIFLGVEYFQGLHASFIQGYIL